MIGFSCKKSALINNHILQKKFVEIDGGMAGCEKKVMQSYAVIQNRPQHIKAPIMQNRPKSLLENEQSRHQRKFQKAAWFEINLRKAEKGVTLFKSLRQSNYQRGYACQCVTGMAEAVHL